MDQTLEWYLHYLWREGYTCGDAHRELLSLGFELTLSQVVREFIQLQLTYH